MSDNLVNCGPGGVDTYFGLRVGSIFIILFGSTVGALFPVLAKNSSKFHVPKVVYDFAKYFGSGVIIATAFIHLLSPGLKALSRSCLSEEWGVYPYALALCLLSIFFIFILELVAFRWGQAKLAKLGLTYETHGVGEHAAHGPEGPLRNKIEHVEDARIDRANVLNQDLLTQMIGIAILEFGVVFHSILIGITLAVDENFKILFIVIAFHQTFEGLAIGSRLAHLDLPKHYNWIRAAGAILFGITTPIGITAGLGVRSTYDEDGVTASIVSGTMDSLSAGILIYTGLVELLAHEFLFNKGMLQSSDGYVAYAVGSMCLGCAAMAFLGKWV